MFLQTYVRLKLPPPPPPKPVPERAVVSTPSYSFGGGWSELAGPQVVHTICACSFCSYRGMSEAIASQASASGNSVVVSAHGVACS